MPVETDRAQQVLANFGTGLARIEVIKGGYDQLARYEELAVDLGQSQSPESFTTVAGAFSRTEAALHIQGLLTRHIPEDDPLKDQGIFDGVGGLDDVATAKKRRLEQERQRWLEAHGHEAEGLAVVLTQAAEDEDGNRRRASVIIGQGYRYITGFLDQTATISGIIVSGNIERSGELVLEDVELEGKLHRQESHGYSWWQKNNLNTRRSNIMPIITKPYERRTMPQRLMATIAMREAA